MDLQHYYSKIREIEANIADEFTVIVSRETPEGGREGTKTQVGRRVAAKMVVEGLARLASAAEKAAFHALQTEAKRMADEIAAASKVEFAVLSTAELKRFKGGTKSKG